jgi:glycosyltransferase involved in cell wall biosynthesis
LMEGFTYPRATQVVTISRGLARELKAAFPYIENKLTVLPNPVRLDRLQMPAEFDRQAFRHSLGIEDQDLVGLFVALGQFERKGLPFLLHALATPGMQRFKLIVVGGQPDLIAQYAERAAKYQVGDRVIFAGMQSDVRPYFWSVDAFVFPSLYEGFPLVTLEAAAAGLPIVVSHLYGVEDMLVDGDNGILVETSVDGVRQGLERFLSLPPSARHAMGQRARKAVSVYSEEHFVDAWRAFYLKLRPAEDLMPVA